MVSREDFDAELDLLEKFEDMIDTQIQTINGIDQKAALSARLIALLVGIIIAAASFVFEEAELLEASDNEIGLILGAAGLIFLLSALVMANITYLSSRFSYGPKPSMGDYMAEYRVRDQEYIDAVLRGYADGLRKNKEVIEVNSNRFKWTLLFLINSLVILSISLVFFIVTPGMIGSLLILFGSMVTVAALSAYIIRQEYLVIEEYS